MGNLYDQLKKKQTPATSSGSLYDKLKNNQTQKPQNVTNEIPSPVTNSINNLEKKGVFENSWDNMDIKDGKNIFEQGAIFRKSIPTGVGEAAVSTSRGLLQAGSKLANKVYNPDSVFDKINKKIFGENYREEIKQNYDKKLLESEHTLQGLDEHLKYDILGEEDYNTLASQMGRAFGQGIFQLGSATLGSAPGLVVIGGQAIDSGTQSYNTAKQTLEDRGDLSPEEIERVARLNGIVTGSVNMIDILIPAKVGSAVRTALSKPVKKLTTDVSTKFLPSTLRIGKTALTESATEAVQDFTSSGTAYLTYDKDKEPFEDALMSFLISLPTSVFFGGVGEVGTRVSQKQFNKLKNEIIERGQEAGLDEETSKTLVNTLLVTNEITPENVYESDLTSESITEIADLLRQEQEGVLLDEEMLNEETPMFQKQETEDIENQQLIEEARSGKYKSAEEFVKALIVGKNGVASIKTELPTNVLETNGPLWDFKPGREIKEPIVVVYDKSKGTYTVVDGHHRYSQALANNQKTIPSRVVFQNENGEFDVFTKSHLEQIWKEANEPKFQKQETEQVSSKLIEDLKGRETVKKAYIEQRIVSSDLNLKQVEKDLARDILKNFDDNVSVEEFTQAMQAELLPLTIGDRADTFAERVKYENIILPDDLRGDVENYDERIYQSPIKTSAGNVHFGGEKGSENYFGHTRIEDMADGTTRRVIEVQSDLFQKGNLEREFPKEFSTEEIKSTLSKSELAKFEKAEADYGWAWDGSPRNLKAQQSYKELSEKAQKILSDKIAKQKSKLQQYNNPTAHFRMVREEVKKASEDGKTTLLFPTGETAMKIEGLGANPHEWIIKDIKRFNEKITPDSQLEVGMEVRNRTQGNSDWIITDVLGDGKFKAVPKQTYDRLLQQKERGEIGDGTFNAALTDRNSETFDISGKIDTSNPIYKFYEKDLAKYLKQQYQATPFTDENGVTWWKVDVKPEYASQPTLAFQKEKTEDKKLISKEQATKQLEGFLKRLKLDVPYQFVETIITPDNERAFGAFFDNTITFEKFVSDTTVLHEIGHSIFKNIDKISLFDGISKTELYEQGFKKYADRLSKEVEIEGKTSKEILDEKKYLVEEYIMEDLEVFSKEINKKEKTITGKIKLFLSKVYKNIKNIFGKRDNIVDFYEKVLKGEATEQTKIESLGLVEEYIENNVLDFRKITNKLERASFKRNKEIQSDRDPLVFLMDMAESFEDGTITKQALEEWRKNLSNGIIELELYEPGGQVIEDGKGGYLREKAKFLSELDAKDRPLSAVKETIKAFSEGVKPTKKKVLFLYNHVITKAFNKLNEEFQQEIGSIANIFETRSISEIKKDIENVNKGKSMTPSQVKKAVGKLLYEGMRNKKYTLSERQLFANKIKNLNKGFRTGLKVGKEIQKEISTEKIEKIRESNRIEKEIQKEKNQIELANIKRSYQLKNLKDNIVRRSYVTKSQEAIQKNIPTDERWEYIAQLARIGKTASLAEYSDLIERVYTRKEQLDIEQGENKDKAKKRQKIGYLRKIHNLSPKLVKDARETLDIKNTIPKMTTEELSSLLAEIGNRISFLKSNNLISQPNTKELSLEDTLKIQSEKPTKIKVKTREVSNILKDVFLTIGERIKRISPEIFYGVETMVYNSNRFLQEEARPVLEKLTQVTKDLQKKEVDIAFKSAILSKRYDLAKELLEMNDIDTSVLDDLKNIFDDLYFKLKSVGVNVEYLENFFPRYLTKEGALALENARNENLNRSIETKEGEIGRALDQEEITKVWASYFRGFDFGSKILLSDGRFGESREIDILDSRKLVDLYQNIPDSFGQYIDQAIKLYESRKFFNKFDPDFIETVKNGDYESGITYFVESLGVKNNYTGQQVKELQNMLQTFFSVVPQSAVAKGMMQFAYTTGLGQIVSFFPQAFEMGVNTAINLEKELTNPFVKLNIKPEDAYLEIRFDAFEDKFSAFSELVTTPMRKGDLLGALVAINQLYNITVSQAKNNSPELRSKVEYIYGKEKTDQVIKTLANSPSKEVGKVSEEMSRILFTEMSERRVTSRLDKSKVFIKNPLWGVFKSYSVKMITKILSDGNKNISNGIKNKDKSLVLKGVRTKSVLITALILSGASQQLVKDFLRGNDVEEIPDYILESFLNIFGLNRYGLDNLSRNGIANTAYQIVAPAPVAIPFSLMETIKRDIEKGDTKIFERLPVAGDIIKIIRNK